ncbi:MAG: hypothetical protein A3F42_00785 [Gammaproteobacteria bacterium RIFCSPHIGHO2_12_FULL_37_34]|nr:MAG: hypothetical protein A3F42_00785 [Gammaproteobacteria bacterium RIFCSPHIGHO2_12_FULL_37_34]
MKFKFVISALIASMSMNAFALEGKGFKILSETIESSPGAIGGFIQQSSSSKPYVYTWSLAHNADGHPHQNVRLWGNHSFNVNNYTKEKQIYTYKYEITCDGQYFRKIDKVQVAPGGFLTDSADSFLYTSHSRAGSWTINVITDVTGESSNNHSSNGTLRIN